MEFQSKFIKSLIEKREQELTDTGIGTSIIKRLTMEINYLKALLVRYEIAKILNLDKDSSFMAKDYLGVEEVNWGDLDLSTEDIKKIFELKAQLPEEQLDIYKKRLRLAEIIKTGLEGSLDSLDNIELSVYVLDQFNLTEEEKDEFLSIVDEINGKSTTKVVPYREEAFRTLQEVFESLNVDNIEDYNGVNESDFEKMDQVIPFIPGEKLKGLFSEIHNYLFALDLIKKYPNIEVTIDLESTKQLLDLLQSSTLDEEKYTQYLDLLCSSLKKLYQVEDNKQIIEEFLNQAIDSNFKLRLDLGTKLQGIENVEYNIKDSELADFFDFVDKNYHLLDEVTRENYYHLIEEKLIEASKNIKTVDLVNQFTMRVTNKDLEGRLREKLSEVPFIKFRNQHNNIFQSIVKSNIDNLEKKKAMYEKKIDKGFLFDARYEAKVREIDKEIKALREMEDDFADKKLQSLDANFNKNLEKIINLEKDIDNLRQLKESVKLRIVQHSIDRKIERRKNKLQKLETKKVKIVGKQTKKLIPEIKLKLKEERELRKYEARGEVFQKYADDYSKTAEAERQLQGMFSGIKAAFYDLRANHYQKKAYFNMIMCEKLRNRKITLQSGNSRMMSSSTYEQIASSRHPEAVHNV